MNCCLKFLFAIALIATACFANNQSLEDLHKSSNVFTVNLFKEYAALTEDKNLMISPLSAYVALAIVADGAAGNTYKQLHRVLSLPDKSVAEETFKNFISEFNVHKNIELSLANTILANEQLRVEPDFELLVKNKFSAFVSKFNPNNRKETANRVNRWASDTTNGKINEIVQPDDVQDLLLMILNAVYFKATWETPFKTFNTKYEIFHKFGRSFSLVPMMKQTGFYRCAELKTLNARFIELPYKNEEYKMTIILPNMNSNVDEVIRNFDASVIDEINGAGDKRVTVFLPKFKIESDLSLNEPLKELGLTDLFSDRINLSGLMKFDGTSVKTVVKQKSFIDVNEKGSEAAAVTDIGIVYVLALPDLPDPIEFKVNRSSLFFISKQNTIMFIGYLKDPQY